MPDKPHTIIIEITPEGKVKGEVKGVNGQHCAPLSEWLDTLGEVLEDRKTLDYSKPDTARVTIHH